MINQFTHLHVHTEYSLLDGFAPISKLMDRVVELGMDAIAITDHGSMFGAVEFYKQAKKRGIKPILGCEIYTCDGNYLEKNPNDKNQHHLVLLAKDQQGYHNLMQIVSEGYVHGFYYRPRVDRSILHKYSQGLVALSACLGGEIQQCLMENDYDKARNLALEYQQLFGKGNFYLELQDHGILIQKQVNQYLKQIHQETGIPMVATNDLHYINREDAMVHDVLLCIQTGKTVDDQERMKFASDEFYLKDGQEMGQLFVSFEGAIENSQRIADMCNVELDFNTIHLPEFQIPEGFTNVGYLKQVAEDGLDRRYREITTEIKDRFAFELRVIENMGYVDYFLIVWDFIRFAKEKGIAVGPGRGSAAGSIVAYALDITDIDPLKYNLLFERFLNPERVSMPDIDIDFCYERREEVIDYVIEKYGEDRVAQIVTFGTMAARGAIRDVGRALNIPYRDVDLIAKKIPAMLGITIDKALELNPDLKEDYESSDQLRHLIDIARSVEGLPRHTSTHAAGVVISKKPVTEYVPLSRNNDAITTQFNMIELEELGLLKMDFLGLRTLTVIQDAVNLIANQHSICLDLDNIDENDPAVLEMFARADTLGIFQFESAGMRAFLKELKPNKFDDLIAANSLFRPGPMNEIPTYIANKNHPERIRYLHSLLEPILHVTYGTIVYQEQVMQIVQKLAGYSLGAADNLRRAMGKKKMSVMEQERKRFIYGELDQDGNILIPGAIRNGVGEKISNQIYDLMIDFAKYAFNKSHSAAYSLVAIRTAWLKHYYPVEYMAALISSVMSNTAQVSLYIQECKRLNIVMLPPDVNYSMKKFVVHDGKIRFGLLAVKNVGAGFIDIIVKARKAGGRFKSFTDFVERVTALDPSALNKKAVESLIKAGAFTSLLDNRAQLMAVFERTIDSINHKNKKNIAGQFSLFDRMEHQITDDVPNILEFKKPILLNMEKEVLGIYITDHPLRPYEQKIKRIANFSTLELMEDQTITGSEALDGKYVNMVGIIIGRNDKLTKNNQFMTFLKVEDLYGIIEVVVFPKLFEYYRDKLTEDLVVVLQGRLSISENEDPKLILDKIKDIESFDQKRLYLNLDEKGQNAYESIKTILRNHHGTTPVYLCLSGKKRALQADRSLWINIDDQGLIQELHMAIGNSNVKIIEYGGSS